MALEEVLVVGFLAVVGIEYGWRGEREKRRSSEQPRFITWNESRVAHGR